MPIRDLISDFGFRLGGFEGHPPPRPKVFQTRGLIFLCEVYKP